MTEEKPEKDFDKDSSRLLAELEAQRKTALDETEFEKTLELTVGVSASHAGDIKPTSRDAGLEVLLPQPGVVTLSTGEEVELKKWTVGMLRRMTADLSLISVTVTTFEQFNLPDEDLVHQLVANNAEQLASLLQATTSWDKEKVDNLDVDDFEVLALGLYRLNVGFFSKSRSMAKRLAATAETQSRET